MQDHTISNSRETPPFLYCYHMSDCSVQCAIGTTKSSEIFMNESAQHRGIYSFQFTTEPIHKKVCKFFNTSKGCHKGDQCDFIHLQVLHKIRACYCYNYPRATYVYMIRTIDDQEAFPVTVFYNGIYPTKSFPSACNKYPKTPAGIAQNTELLLLLYPRATYAWYKRMTSKLANILLLQDSPKPPSPAPPPVSSTPPPPHNPAHQGHQPSCPEMLFPGWITHMLCIWVIHLPWHMALATTGLHCTTGHHCTGQHCNPCHTSHYRQFRQIQASQHNHSQLGQCPPSQHLPGQYLPNHHMIRPELHCPPSQQCTRCTGQAGIVHRSLHYLILNFALCIRTLDSTYHYLYINPMLAELVIMLQCATITTCDCTQLLALYKSQTPPAFHSMMISELAKGSFSLSACPVRNKAQQRSNRLID